MAATLTTTTGGRVKVEKAKRLGKPPSPAERATQAALQAERRTPTAQDVPVSTFPGAPVKPLPGQIDLDGQVVA